MSAGAQKPDVDLLATDELIAALFARFDHVVFSAYQALTDDQSRYIRRWKGNTVMCGGLGLLIAHDATAEHVATEVRIQGEDESQ
ncbi:MAG: hypothetical protein PHU85_00350 [Phycisphaerae bacterium]|nr:hypothetical protein [Phycisphaerae bacterium]